MAEDNKNNKASFLTDEEDYDENLDYVKPNIEHKLPAHKRMECREIVKEVRNFGVSQRQLLYLIYLLSRELENREVMVALTKAIGDNREKIKLSNLILPEDD